MADIDVTLGGQVGSLRSAFLVEVGGEYTPPTTLTAVLGGNIQALTGKFYVSIDSVQPSFGVPQLIDLVPYNVADTYAYAQCSVVYLGIGGDIEFQSTSLLDGTWNTVSDAVIIAADEFYLDPAASSRIQIKNEYFFQVDQGNTISIKTSLKDNGSSLKRVVVSLINKAGTITYGSLEVNLTESYAVSILEVVMPESAEVFVSIRNGDAGESKAVGFQYLSVINDNADAAVPELVTASCLDSLLTLAFSESVTGTTGFSAEINGVAATLSNLQVNGSVATYVMPQTYLNDVVTVSYSPGDFVDTAGNALAAITDQAVDNQSTQENLSQLYLSTSLLDGTWLVLSDAVIVDADSFTTSASKTSSRISFTAAGRFAVVAGDQLRATVWLKSEDGGAEDITIQIVDQAGSTIIAESTETLTTSFAEYTIEGTVLANTNAQLSIRSGEFIAKQIGFQSAQVWKI